MAKQRKQVNFHGLVLPEIREYRIACAEEEKSMAKQTRTLIVEWMRTRRKKP